MAVVKSPKNVKRKNLWMTKISSKSTSLSVNYFSRANKLYKVKPKKWISSKSKNSVLRNLVPIYLNI